MATVVNKDFKIKSGLIVEGTTGTINGYDILTKKQADQEYIIGLIGGTATPENTPETVVKRDANGSFAANVVTANTITIPGAGSISEDGELLITASEGEDIRLSADDVRVDAVDDFRVNVGGDILLATSGVETNVYVGSIDTGNEIVVESTLDAHIGDGTVDGTAGNTVTDRISTASTNALNTATAYTDTREGAITTAYQAYADTAESDAIASANSYTDGREAAVTTAYQNYADGAVEDHNDLTTGVHGVTGNVVGTTDVQTISNKTLGSDLAAGGYKVSGLADPAANQDAATKSYVDTAVANLVDSAPAVLDTLNELAAAIGDDANFVTTVTASIGEKVAKAGDSMTGDLDFGGTNKVTSLAAPTANGDAANKLYVDTAEADAITSANSYTDGREAAITTAYEAYADQAELDAVTTANLYTDGEISDLDTAAQGYANTAQSNAESFATSAINALTTSDIEEGTNLYYTDDRAQDAVGSMLQNAVTENISISYNNVDNVLTITAENGVAQSTTNDLVEGSDNTGANGGNNLYFTDQRVLDATSNAASVEVQKLDISWVRREEAAYASVATASTATVHSFGTNEGSVKYLVRVYNNNKSHVTEVLATTDSDNNVAVVEYGTIYTSENPLATVTVAWNAVTSQYDLNVTTANNNSEVLVSATLLAYND